LLGLIAVVGVGGFAWAALQGGQHSAGGGEEPIPVGQQVEPFELPDIASGRDFSTDEYLGKQEIVLVGYMGFF
jgi:hypothetical protein